MGRQPRHELTNYRNRLRAPGRAPTPELLRFFFKELSNDPFQIEAIQWKHTPCNLWMSCSLLQFAAACCNMLQLPTSCCSLLQLAAACCAVHQFPTSSVSRIFIPSVCMLTCLACEDRKSLRLKIGPRLHTSTITHPLHHHRYNRYLAMGFKYIQIHIQYFFKLCSNSCLIIRN